MKNSIKSQIVLERGQKEARPGTPQRRLGWGGSKKVEGNGNL